MCEKTTATSNEPSKNRKRTVRITGLNYYLKLFIKLFADVFIPSDSMMIVNHVVQG